MPSTSIGLVVMLLTAALFVRSHRKATHIKSQEQSAQSGSQLFFRLGFMTYLRVALIAFAFAGLLMSPIRSEAADDRWIGKTARYEGSPLALRIRPHVLTAENQRSFPQLVAITLRLAKVRADGMPESDYNDTLADLDAELIGLFERNKVGLTVLVETFDGRRIFYSFTQANAPVRAMVADFEKRNPGHAIFVQVKPDPDWGFIANYRKQFPW